MIFPGYTVYTRYTILENNTGLYYYKIYIKNVLTTIMEFKI